jgi:flagellar basal-body rod protein FlgB
MVGLTSVLLAGLSGLRAAQTGVATVSQNIANANTPGYKRKDVDFHDALRTAMGEGASALQNVGFSVQTDQSATRADGNGVDIDVESANLAENGLEYQALVQVARGRLDILDSAIGH